MNTHMSFKIIFFLTICNLLLISANSIDDNYNNDSNKKYFQVSNDWYEAYRSTTPTPPEMSKKTSTSSTTPRLLFPPGIKLDVEPILTIPVLNQDIFGVGTSFKMSIPVTILLDKLSLRSWNDIKDMDTEIVIWDNHKNGFIKARRKRAFSELESNYTSFSEKSSLCRKLSLQKLAMFKKVESLMNSYNGNWRWSNNNNNNAGLSPTSGEGCLLRTICEIYHFPITEEFGVFGDLLRELVRSDRFTKMECVENESIILTKYIEAQRSGENGSCRKYHKKCQKSLFY